MPPGARSVARPGPFGNPFRATTQGDPAAHAEAVEAFRAWVMHADQAAFRARVRSELRGLCLACWCPPGLACHADVLLLVANGEEPKTAPASNDQASRGS